MSELTVKNEYLQSTVALKNAIEQSFITLGERLYNIRTNELWQGVYETYELFLDDLGMSPSTASKLVSIHETFTVKLGMKNDIIDVPWSNLYSVIPFCTDKSSAAEWVTKAKTLIRRDLDIEISEKKTGIVQYECKCDEETYTITICKKCGKKVKEND